MTLDHLKQMIRCAEFAGRANLEYECEERLGILCGTAEPTEEQVDIVKQQLFPTQPQTEMPL